MSSTLETFILSQDDTLLTPSNDFKKEAIKSVGAIVVFIIVYLLLIALSLLLVAFCIFAGFALIKLRITFYTLIIGLSIIGSGILVFVFLIKFLFATSKEDNSDSIELLEHEEPVLFQTIYQLAEETNTTKPKKIFISADVNASVFYNSSFWSMFLPIRKNLKIGLGLVNTLNISELKAVIAHEFGHFSQRSMKLGSWVYAVNKIIYDMLYNNSGYAKGLDSIAALNNIASFFVQLTIKVVQGIQWVLAKMYGVVNKTYMGLSRQMEFHADLVSASACGSNNIISALQRIEFSDVCFSRTLDICNQAWQEKMVVMDFYSGHRCVIKHLAQLNGLSIMNGLPEIQKEDENGQANRVNFKNQWASHPTLSERKSYLESFNLIAPVDSTSAWSLFRNEEKWKQVLTQQFYKSIPVEEIAGQLELPQFEERILSELQHFSYPSIYKDFYDNRTITEFDPLEESNRPIIKQAFESVLTQAAFHLPKQIRYLEQDMAILKAIMNKEVDTDSFDFDGQKYSRNQAAEILSQLEEESVNLQKALETIDKSVFRYFFGLATFAEAEALAGSYIQYFIMRNKADAFADAANKMFSLLSPVFSGETLTLEEINALILKLKKEHEPFIKQELHYWLETGAFHDDAEVTIKVEKFNATEYHYFSGSSFFDNELAELNEVVRASWSSISKYIFSLFKAITQTQATLLEKAKSQVLAD